MNVRPLDFEIAPNFRASQWKALAIQKSTKWSDDWERAVSAFEKRINARFLNQIDALISNRDKATARFSGFAIVALDCLLIETLDQFYNGNHTTRRKTTKIDDPDVAAFHAVFQRSSKLGGFFDTVEKTKVFYQHVRCGLLHQAQTKKNSKINRRIKTVIEWLDATKPEEGLVVQPRLFHNAVSDVFLNYLKYLREEQNGNPRGKFRKKMNRIAGMK
jgi:hypothetical protein